MASIESSYAIKIMKEKHMILILKRHKNDFEFIFVYGVLEVILRVRPPLLILQIERQ